MLIERAAKVCLLVFIMEIIIFSGNAYAQNNKVVVPRVGIYENTYRAPAMIQGLGFFTHSSKYDALNLTDILNDKHLYYDVLILSDKGSGNNEFPRYINNTFWQKLIEF